MISHAPYMFSLVKQPLVVSRSIVVVRCRCRLPNYRNFITQKKYRKHFNMAN